MDINQLKYFISTAQAGTMTRAAGELYITQPALSKALTKLERELGLRLFDRRKGKIELTQTGRIFLENIIPAVKAVEDAVSAAMSGSEGAGGSVTVGSSIAFPITNVILNYCKSDPLCSIVHNMYRADQIYRELADGGIDFAVSLSPPPAGSFETYTFCNFPPALLLSPSNPLLGAEKIALKDLKAQAFVCESNIVDKKTLQAVCSEAGFAPRIILETADRFIINGIMATTPTVSFIPMTVAYDKLCIHVEHDGREVIRKLYGCSRSLGLYLAANREKPLSGPSLNLFRFVRSALAELEADVDGFLSGKDGKLR